MNKERDALPAIIYVTNTIRLTRYQHPPNTALNWYQDMETVFLVDGRRERYDETKLNGMYTYLNEHMALYIIEVLEAGTFLPIGDVAFSEDDLPIVIGDVAYRQKGIGKQVILAIIEQAKKCGYSSLGVKTIYFYNVASQKLFESIGFVKQGESENGFSYALDLNNHTL